MSVVATTVRALPRGRAAFSVLSILFVAIAAAPPAVAEPRSSFPRDFVALPDATVFVASTTGHPEPSTDHTSLWRTDGDAGGTFELRLCSSVCDPQARILARSGELAFVAAYDENLQWQMWRTDGSQEGTLRLTDFQALSSPPQPKDVVWAEDLGRLYFVVEELAGWSLWASDGTAVGTSRVVALPATVQLEPFGLVMHHGAVYFFAPTVELGLGGQQLWRSGGTAAATSLVATIEGYLNPWEFGPATSLPHGLVFALTDQSNGDRRLWASDGTSAGTAPLAGFAANLNFSPQLKRVGDLAWFWAFDDINGRQLWASDGSAAGTRRLTSIAQPGGSLSSGAWDPLPWQDGVVFGAQVAPSGFELWASDGTPEGTGRLLDLCAGPCGALPVLTATTDEHLYFGHAGHHWQSDGTLAGTRKLADVAFSTPSLTVPPVLVVGDHLFLRGIVSQNDFEELWAVERATGVVRQVTDLGVSPLRFGHDWQVGVLGDRLLFAADDGLHGLEPWISDGTPAGTRMIADVAAGGDGFPTCYEGDRILCLGGGRFRVEVTWDDHHNGGSGVGHALHGTDLSGYFWFFSPDNVELIVKVLDGTTINGFHWTFYGALTDVEYELTVSDTVTGEHRTYHNPPGEICGRGDTTSLPGASATAGNRAASAARQRALSLPATDGSRTVDGVFAAAHPEEPCVAADAATLCLLDGRFRVRVDWQDQHNGGSGQGGALPFTDISGFFWFFTPNNVELVVKALDARTLDGNFWFFYGALSDVGYTITVEDLVDGHRAREYVNPPGELCGEGDTSAFSG